MLKRITVSELIKVLSKIQSEHGDLEISINVQDGGSYSLHSEEDVHLEHRYDTFGTEIPIIEIVGTEYQ